MIEVFKTNVKDELHAQIILGQIHEIYPGYSANFDLWDRDNILRIKGEGIQVLNLIVLLAKMGCEAEVLPDIIEVPD